MTSVTLDAILARLVDVWMPYLAESQLRLVLALISRGHYGERGFPRRDQAELRGVVGVERQRLYQLWGELLDLGLIVEAWEPPGVYCLAVNPEWAPPADLAPMERRWRRGRR